MDRFTSVLDPEATYSSEYGCHSHANLRIQSNLIRFAHTIVY